MPPQHRELTAGDPVAAAPLNWINWAALAIMTRHRGELTDAERLARLATPAWQGSLDLMGAADGVEFLGVLAAARERFSDAAQLLAGADAARPRLQYLSRASPPAARPAPTPPAWPGTSSETTASPTHGAGPGIHPR